MTNQIQIFNFENQNVRIKIIESAEYFCAKDVCDILEYSNSREAVNDNCEKDGVAISDTIDSLGRTQKLTFINEPNLFRLIIKSKMPKAKKFEKWVFEEVLPSIRKTGGYQLPKTINSDFLLEIAHKMKELEIKNQKQETIIEKHIAIDKTKSYTEVAKLLHISPRFFINVLKSNGYIRQNREPYQKYIDAEYFVIKKTIQEMGDKIKHCESYHITDKGFQYFFKKMNQENYQNN
jgi:prophage antirepressor-like protein